MQQGIKYDNDRDISVSITKLKNYTILLITSDSFAVSRFLELKFSKYLLLNTHFPKVFVFNLLINRKTEFNFYKLFRNRYNHLCPRVAHTY